MDNIYKIKWRSFGIINLPTFLRGKKMVALLYAFLFPLTLLLRNLFVLRADSFYKLKNNSQICHIRGVLNDYFDHTERRIQVSNSQLREPLWFYEPEELSPVILYEPEDNSPKYFREPVDFVSDGADFIVEVPLALRPNNTAAENALLIKMSALIDYYKLFSKNYTIKWV